MASVMNRIITAHDYFPPLVDYSVSLLFFLQGRVCNSSRHVTSTGTGVRSGAVCSVSIRLEESPPAGTVEPTGGPSHLQQSLLCTAEREHSQVTCILQVNQRQSCLWIGSVIPSTKLFQFSW